MKIEQARSLLRQRASRLLRFCGVETPDGKAIDAPVPTVVIENEVRLVLKAVAKVREAQGEKEDFRVLAALRASRGEKERDLLEDVIHRPTEHSTSSTIVGVVVNAPLVARIEASEEHVLERLAACPRYDVKGRGIVIECPGDLWGDVREAAEN